MTAVRNVTATFVRQFQLSVSKSGSGTVTRIPEESAAARHVPRSSTTRDVGDPGRDPRSGLELHRVERRVLGQRQLPGDDGRCKVSDRDLYAQPARSASLSVQKNGSGDGTVTSNPAGIDCGGRLR